MSKSLKTVQSISKAAKIICRVLFILSVIGAAGCVVSLIGLALTEALGPEALAALISIEPGSDMPSLYLDASVSLVSCVAGCLLFKLAEGYFAYEISAGTPFTFEGADRAKRLGIISIAIAVAQAVVISLICGIFMLISPSVTVPGDGDISIGMGLALLILSAVFRYGAELEQRANLSDDGTK